MGKFYGAIGYGTTAETSPGVWEVVITERNYYGDVLRNSRRYQPTENLNDNLTLNNEFSIIADTYAYQNFHLMRYIQWGGTKWKVTEITEQRPRLILRIGGVYTEQS